MFKTNKSVIISTEILLTDEIVEDNADFLKFRAVSDVHSRYNKQSCQVDPSIFIRLHLKLNHVKYISFKSDEGCRVWREKVNFFLFFVGMFGLPPTEGVDCPPPRVWITPHRGCGLPPTEGVDCPPPRVCGYPPQWVARYGARKRSRLSGMA